jgi:hypothetical protein
MLFDCAALAIGLYTSYIARLPANGMYTFGRGRFEVLSGYVNAVFLVLVGVLIVLDRERRRRLASLARRWMWGRPRNRIGIPAHKVTRIQEHLDPKHNSGKRRQGIS